MIGQLIQWPITGQCAKYKGLKPMLRWYGIPVVINVDQSIF